MYKKHLAYLDLHTYDEDVNIRTFSNYIRQILIQIPQDRYSINSMLKIVIKHYPEGLPNMVCALKHCMSDEMYHDYTESLRVYMHTSISKRLSTIDSALYSLVLMLQKCANSESETSQS